MSFKLEADARSLASRQNLDIVDLSTLNFLATFEMEPFKSAVLLLGSTLSNNKRYAECRCVVDNSFPLPGMLCKLEIISEDVAAVAGRQKSVFAKVAKNDVFDTQDRICHN